jgi:hypothetical protein
MDGTGTTLIAGDPVGSSIDRQIQHFTAPASGEYVLKFSQAALFDALITRNAAVHTGPNNIATASDITPSGHALGAVYHSGVELPAFHKIMLEAGAVLTLTTSTPFDGPLDVLSSLDATLELFDPDGNPLATNDNGAADGRNARIVHTAADAGFYYVRVGAAPGSSGGYLLSADIGGGDATAPTVVAVYLDSPAWTDAFRNHLAASGAGGTSGYAVPTAPGAQLTPLPWTNLSRIAIRFSENVVVNADDLSLFGVSTPDFAAALAAGSFTYDSASFTATWSLATSMGADKLLISLSDQAADLAGNPLDGDWQTGDAFPSGDGLPGGGFAFRLNILPGNVNQDARVLGNDVILVRNAQFQAVGSPLYSALLDVDGSGTVLGNDVINVRNRQFTELPAGEPGAIAMLVMEEPAPAPLAVTSPRLAPAAPPASLATMKPLTSLIAALGAADARAIRRPPAAAPRRTAMFAVPEKSWTERAVNRLDW